VFEGPKQADIGIKAIRPNASRVGLGKEVGDTGRA
jgi:hypothetical protein